MKKVIAFLVMVCMLLTSVAMAEETAALQEVKCGNVTLQLPAGIEVRMDGSVLYGENADYQISSIVMNWAEMDLDISKLVPNGDMQIDNAAALMIYMDIDSELINAMLNVFVKEDIGMLNGDPVLHIDSVTSYIICHYYRGTGILTIAYALTEDGSAVIKDVCMDMMKSARWDGVTEEDMIADAQADYVVVTADSGRIRAEASLSGEMIKTAYKGETYKLIEHSGDWYIIEVDGRTGYLHTGVAEIQ